MQFAFFFSCWGDSSFRGLCCFILVLTEAFYSHIAARCFELFVIVVKRLFFFGKLKEYLIVNVAHKFYYEGFAF